MSDNIDDFLASLVMFDTPSLTASIDQYLSEHSQPQQPIPLREDSGPETKPRAHQRKRNRSDHVDSTAFSLRGTEQGSPLSEVGTTASCDGTPSTSVPLLNRRNTSRPAQPRQESTSWVCSRCTLINDTKNTCCGACEAPCSKSTAAGTAMPTKEGTACPRCTFINKRPSATARVWLCEMCCQAMPIPSLEARSAASKSTTTSSVQVLLRNQTRGGSSSSEVPVLAQTGAASSPLVLGSTEPRPSNAGMGVEETEETEEEFLLNSSITESSLDDSDEEGESEGSGGSGNDARGKPDVAGYRELVHFLQALESVPYDRLPCAGVPPTMAGAELRPFQLQALHWLQHQEQVTGYRPPSNYSPSQSQSIGSLDEASAHDGAGTALGEGYGPNKGGPFSPRALASVGEEEATWQAAKSVRGGIFADFMGLGKTRTMIALCEATRRPRVNRVTGSQVESVATLVVCPSALLHVWLSELLHCVQPVPNVMLYHGSNRRRRLSLFDLAQKYDYVLTSYQTLRHESSSQSASPGKLYMIRWQRIVLDEAHVIRSIRAQQTRACLKLSGICKWVVTATPVYNSLNDLFPLLKFLDVPYFGVLQWWNEEIVRHFNIDIHHPRPTTALRILFSSLLLRRTPDSIVGGQRILELPPKRIQTELVSVSQEEREFYDAIHTNANHKLNLVSKRQAMGGNSNGSQLATFNTAFEMMIRCRQALLHPYIVVAALRHCSNLGDNTQQVSKFFGSSDKNTRGVGGEDDQTSLAIQHYIDTVLRNRIVAKNSTFFQELVEELKRHELGKRECIICLDHVNRPAILPCGHTFCAECIDHALQLNRCCPMCKRPTKSSQVAVVPLEFVSLNDNKDAHGHEGGAARRLLDALEGVNLADYTNWPISLSTKTQWLINALRRIPPDEKAIVFSTFVTYLRYLQHCLNEKGVSNLLYSGDLTFKEKDTVLKCFRGEGPAPRSAGDPQQGAPRVLLATFSSCGVGLNLTAANHCFLMEPLWSPGLEEQALHRVHRIGQTRPVTMTKLLARGTVEENIERLCQQKRTLSGYCFQSGEGGSGPTGLQGGDVHRLRTEDLLALFANSPAGDTDETGSSESDSSSEDNSEG